MFRLGVVAAALGCALAGCRIPPSAYAYEVGIEVPTTPEGQACRRQCLTSIGVCSNYTTWNGAEMVPLFPHAGEYSSRFGCPGLVSDCLATCPGAHETAGGPRVVPIGGVDWDDSEFDVEEEE